MMKRLTALLMLLLLLCPTAQAAGKNGIYLEKVLQAGRGSADWFASQADKEQLIALVAAQLKADSGFRKTYSGFDVDVAVQNACAGVDGSGLLFVAMRNEKTSVVLVVTFDGQTCEGTYLVKAGADDLFKSYQHLANSTWNDPGTAHQSLEDMYALASASLVIQDPSLVRRFHEDVCIVGGQSWLAPKSNMAILALVMHYQYSRTLREDPLLATFDGANALETCYFMQRADAPEVIALAYLDDESHTLLLSELDTAAMTVTCRLYTEVHLTHLPRFTTLYDTALLIDQNDMLMAMIDVNVALAGEP